MRQHYRGRSTARGLRIGVVVSRFNSVVTERLLEGALDGLQQHGVRRRPHRGRPRPGRVRDAADRRAACARAGALDAIICLGAVVRGETPHFDMIAQWVVAELGRL